MLSNEHYRMGGCQNCGPLLGTLNIRCRIIIGTQMGATTTHVLKLPGTQRKVEKTVPILNTENLFLGAGN